MKRFLAWFFSRPKEASSWIKVVSWWEIRRIPYNAIVILAGIISSLLFLVFIQLAHELKPGEDAIEPLALFAAFIIVNVLYTGGWMVELVSRGIRQHLSPRFGPVLLKVGTALSIGVILLPTVVWFFIWIFRSTR
jgi:hypothetical protein